MNVKVRVKCVFGTSFRIDDHFQPSNSLMNKHNFLRYKLNISTIYALQMFGKTSATFLILKCAIFEEHLASCVVYFQFSGTLFPVSMIDSVFGFHANKM